MKRLPVLALLPLLFLCQPVCRADPMTDDFQWFTSLGWGDVKGLKPVSFAGSYWSSGGTADMKPLWEGGFLLEDSPENFRVLMLNFSSQKIEKKGVQAGMEYRWAPLDLAAAAQNYLDALKAANSGLPRKQVTAALPHFDEALVRPGAHYSDRAKLFVLAWACWREGLDAPAATLYKAAQEASGVHVENAADDKGWPFRRKLERDLGQFDLWRVMLDFRDTSIPRAELAKHLRQLATEFPHCDYIQQVNATADTLEKMVAGDKAHEWITADQIAKLTPEEQAKEWIFRLRDQTVFYAPPYGGFGEDKDSPASHLVALGDPAVPQLIQAIGDTRCTRMLNYWREFYFSHSVTTVGSAAYTVIERIAGHTLACPDRLRDAAPLEQSRGMAEDWWNARKQKGELGELSDDTAAGGPFSDEAGRRLLEKYAASAAAPLIAGAQAAKDWYTRDKLIGLLATAKDDRVKPFLIKTAQESPDIATRAQAALELVRLGSTDGIPPLAEAWQNGPPATDGQPGNPRKAAVYVLGNTDSPAGFEALAKGLRGRSLDAQQYIIRSLCTNSGEFTMQLYGAISAARQQPALSPQSQAALETLLSGELDGGNSVIFNSRVGQLAAMTLARIWPARYQFDATASWAARDRQRIIALNTWRKSQNLAPLPLPPEPALVKQEDSGKVVLIVRDSAAPELPAAAQKAIDAAQGRKLDAALLREISTAVTDSAKKPGDPFAIEAMRSAGAPGVTLLVEPAPWRITGNYNAPARPGPWESELLMNLPNFGNGNSFLEKAAPYIDTLPGTGQFTIELIFSPPGYVNMPLSL